MEKTIDFKNEYEFNNLEDLFDSLDIEFTITEGNKKSSGSITITDVPSSIVLSDLDRAITFALVYDYCESEKELFEKTGVVLDPYDTDYVCGGGCSEKSGISFGNIYVTVSANYSKGRVDSNSHCGFDVYDWELII